MEPKINKVFAKFRLWEVTKHGAVPIAVYCNSHIFLKNGRHLKAEKGVVLIYTLQERQECAASYTLIGLRCPISGNLVVSNYSELLPIQRRIGRNEVGAVLLGWRIKTLY